MIFHILSVITFYLGTIHIINRIFPLYDNVLIEMFPEFNFHFLTYIGDGGKRAVTIIATLVACTVNMIFPIASLMVQFLVFFMIDVVQLNKILTTLFVIDILKGRDDNWHHLLYCMINFESRGAIYYLVFQLLIESSRFRGFVLICNDEIRQITRKNEGGTVLLPAIVFMERHKETIVRGRIIAMILIVCILFWNINGLVISEIFFIYYATYDLIQRIQRFPIE